MKNVHFRQMFDILVRVSNGQKLHDYYKINSRKFLFHWCVLQTDSRGKACATLHEVATHTLLQVYLF